MPSTGRLDKVFPTRTFADLETQLFLAMPVHFENIHKLKHPLGKQAKTNASTKIDKYGQSASTRPVKSNSELTFDSGCVLLY